MTRATFFKLKILFVLIFISAFFLNMRLVSARENVNDWYIKEFDSNIIVNKDSSLDISEKITADCGNAQGKHGIFRILPESINVKGEKIKTPIELVNITDFNSNPLRYLESRNYSDSTVTWKIGDANKSVQGENYYWIHYKVKNVIRFWDEDFDEFYWNLTGNFWDLEIDRFHTSIVFPDGVSQENSTVEYYTGFSGEKRKDLANYQWNSDNVLEFNSIKMLEKQQGITVSVIFPKNIFIPYKFSFWELYGKYFSFLIPITAFFVCFMLWWKYGRDPKIDKTIIPEYDAPGNLSPIELGMLMSNGTFKNSFITAEIINFATKKIITIKEIDEKVLFFHNKDYELFQTNDIDAEGKLNIAQARILSKVFEKSRKIKLASLKTEFYTAISDIKDKTKKLLESKKLIVISGLYFRIAFMATGVTLMFVAFITAALSVFFMLSLFISGIIFLIFSFIMPKRTPAGAELNWQIKGFKLFMETVDKDRAAFYEKENIFEKFLPYAIIFGITEIWINKMKEIYGEDFYANYAPVWYAGNIGSFDAGSFSNTIDSLSSSIAASTSSPSGSGGGGGAGGGGGGGGGGGW
jgi:uncharacterized membrane protein